MSTIFLLCWVIQIECIGPRGPGPHFCPSPECAVYSTSEEAKTAWHDSLGDEAHVGMSYIWQVSLPKEPPKPTIQLIPRRWPIPYDAPKKAETPKGEAQ